jgi:hypothetical protein
MYIGEVKVILETALGYESGDQAGLYSWKNQR